MSRKNHASWTQAWTVVILVAVLAGCKRDEAQVYHVPKDDSQPAQPDTTPVPDSTAAQPPGQATGMVQPTDSASPQLTYKVPEGWQEKPPSEMRVASFTASGPNGESADISAIPLGIVGRDMELVNMWRSQVQLPPATDPDAVNQAEPVAIGGEQGRLFDYVSDQPMIGKSRQRMMVARLTRGDMSWFFKRVGQEACGTAQKEKFLQFLKSIAFVENASPQMPVAPIAQNAASNVSSIWTIPDDWQAMPPAQFLLAEFSVPGSSGTKAEVNVAEMDGEGGGLLANVNRWRGQLGLPPAADTDLPQLTQSLDVPGGKAAVMEFAGVNAKTGARTRLIGVIVPQNNQTWFYKMMGDDPVVTQQKAAFLKFIQTANYANARLPTD